jgi:hypothetical protein
LIYGLKEEEEEEEEASLSERRGEQAQNSGYMRCAVA